MKMKFVAYPYPEVGDKVYFFSGGLCAYIEAFIGKIRRYDEESYGEEDYVDIWYGPNGEQTSGRGNGEFVSNLRWNKRTKKWLCLGISNAEGWWPSTKNKTWDK